MPKATSFKKSSQRNSKLIDSLADANVLRGYFGLESLK